MKNFQWNTAGSASHTFDGITLETACYGPSPDEAPTLILLHEGLGCIALWRSFPVKLAAHSGCGVFVYSRRGYGASDTVTLPRPLDYMTNEAEALSGILDALQIKKAVLLGHSDGASIASIYAGSVQDHRVRGLILMAPHFFVEPISIKAIEKARTEYDSGALKEKLGKYHQDVDAAFNGWCDTWLDNKFRSWNIADNIDYLRIPVLAIQGTDDPYGTLAQLDELEQRSYAPVEKVILANCQHSPHLEKQQQTLDAIQIYLRRLWQMEGIYVSPKDTQKNEDSLPDTEPLPGYKHLPGKNARPVDGLLEAIAETASAVTKDASYRSNAAWLYGIRLFNNGFYWEAHEVLETVWNNAAPNSREKHLVQGVIQMANAQLKASLEQTKAADRLQKLAAECITRAYARGISDCATDVSEELLLGLECKEMQTATARCDQRDVVIILKLR